ncbi:MAG: NPCBM/NEW2 domain-containing protein [Desulfotomaculaceae bacterium]|nr:NPCBM/NEW2 domain-containing protein [Desulfotomaculaceae bacterium]MDD4767084.1 NPCBM/NEW2 domain-containing protein [Desulfotomaculaceae bacterium]
MRAKFLLPLLAALVLGIAVGAYADNGIRIFVNGQQVTSDVQPFIQDGRTMVPLRVISEALGAEVAWDQDTQTVTIVTKAEEPGEEPQEIPAVNDLTKDIVNLSDLQPANQTPDRVFFKNWGENEAGPTGVFSIANKKYFDGIGMLNFEDARGTVVAEYEIEGLFKKLTATVGASDLGSGLYRGKTHLQIYGDDKLLYNSQAFDYSHNAREIDVNIVGVKTLRLVSYADKGVGAVDAVWADIRLHKKY